MISEDVFSLVLGGRGIMFWVFLLLNDVDRTCGLHIPAQVS